MLHFWAHFSFKFHLKFFCFSFSIFWSVLIIQCLFYYFFNFLLQGWWNGSACKNIPDSNGNREWLILEWLWHAHMQPPLPLPRTYRHVYTSTSHSIELYLWNSPLFLSVNISKVLRIQYFFGNGNAILLAQSKKLSKIRGSCLCPIAHIVSPSKYCWLYQGKHIQNSIISQGLHPFCISTSICCLHLEIGSWR